MRRLGTIMLVTYAAILLWALTGCATSNGGVMYESTEKWKDGKRILHIQKWKGTSSSKAAGAAGITGSQKVIDFGIKVKGLDVFLKATSNLTELEADLEPLIEDISNAAFGSP